MTHEPFISLALAVKNGLPGLRRTVSALQRQNYPNFELIVQDGGSTDGSLDYLESAKLPRIDIVSEPDNGIGQAYNRALRRCQGPLVAMLACGEWLEEGALKIYATWHEQHPNAAFVYGAVRLWKSVDEMDRYFSPGKFDLLKLLMSDVTPTLAGFFNKEVVGEDLYLDEALPTSPDFDLFMRLGMRFNSLELIEKPSVLLNAMADRSSPETAPENYDQIARDRRYILDRFFVQQGNSPLNQHLRDQCVSAMYCRLAGQLLGLAGETPRVHHFIIEAARYNPGSAAIEELVGRTEALAADPLTGQILLRRMVQPDLPPEAARPLGRVIDLASTQCPAEWGAYGASVDGAGPVVRVTTAPVPWGYAALVPLRFDDDWIRGAWYWAELRLRVTSGQAGIAFVKDLQPRNERMVSADAEARLVIPFLRTDEALLIRNGPDAESALLELIEARVFGMPTPGSLPEELAEEETLLPSESKAPRLLSRLRLGLSVFRSGVPQG